MNPKRKTSGIRVPNSPICLALIEALGNPIISTSALTLAPGAGNGSKLTIQKPVLFDALEKLVDIIIDDDQPLAYEVSTILDVSETEPVIVRQGLGWQEAMEWGVQPVSV
jgi:tRNA A37 threonylcarbamoyladenosine synthetase subunit TsaC/SUA5/YrdC